jgi:hypothetical protein
MAEAWVFGSSASLTGSLVNSLIAEQVVQTSVVMPVGD